MRGDDTAVGMRQVARAGLAVVLTRSASVASWQPHRCRGIALVEVLVAILLAGLAVTTGLGLALRGLADTVEARLRQQAIELAADMAGRVRALPGVDWTAVAPGAPCVGACSPDALAAAELGEWRKEVIGRLPDAEAALQAAAGGALVVVVRWSGRGGESSELRLGVQP
jgi:type IV pilus assembly protein PilV